MWEMDVTYTLIAHTTAVYMHQYTYISIHTSVYIL